MKAEILSFNGNVDIEGCLDWLYEVETFFEVMEVPEDRRVPLVAYKLKGGAGAWWHRIQEERMLRGEPPVRTRRCRTFGTRSVEREESSTTSTAL